MELLQVEFPCLAFFFRKERRDALRTASWVMLCRRPARERRTTSDRRADVRDEPGGVVWHSEAAMGILLADRLGDTPELSSDSALNRSDEEIFTTASDTSISSTAGPGGWTSSVSFSSGMFSTASSTSSGSLALAALLRVLRLTGSLSDGAVALLRRVRRAGSSELLSGASGVTSSEMVFRVSWTEERRRLLRLPLEKLERKRHALNACTNIYSK